MLALATANAVAVVLFGALYAVAGARVLPQPAFVAGLVTLFALMTVMWVRTEARQRGVPPARRAARVLAGLAIVVVATPVAVLAPLFWLDDRLPVDAGLHAVRGGVMALVLITLVLVVLVNVAGSLVVAGRALFARRRPLRQA